MIKSLRYLFATLAGYCAFLALPSIAFAQTCDISGLATSQSATLIYDPFGTSGAASTTPLTMAITRLNPQGGTRTEQVNMYLTVPGTNVPGIEIIPRSVSGASNTSGTGIGNNIFYNHPTAPTLPSATSVGVGNFLTINYGSDAAIGDTATVTFDVMLPRNLDLRAIERLAFRAEFSCRFKGQGNSKIWNSGFRNDAIVFPITVLSALQARYGGEVLDFGEVGNMSNADIGGSAYTKTGTIYVRSSGAYEIRMTSDNDYRLAPSTAGAAVSGTSLTYRATLVGEIRNGVSGAANNVQMPITKICSQAGLIERSLPLTVALTEGGNSKMPAPVYSDFLNVTVTPQIASVVGSACP